MTLRTPQGRLRFLIFVHLALRRSVALVHTSMRVNTIFVRAWLVLSYESAYPDLLFRVLTDDLRKGLALVWHDDLTTVDDWDRYFEFVIIKEWGQKQIR